MSFDVNLPDETIESAMNGHGRGRGPPPDIRAIVDQRMKKEHGIERRNEAHERKKARKAIEDKHRIFTPESVLEGFAPPGFQSVSNARARSGFSTVENERAKSGIEIMTDPNEDFRRFANFWRHEFMPPGFANKRKK